MPAVRVHSASSCPGYMWLLGEGGMQNPVGRRGAFHRLVSTVGGRTRRETTWMT